MTESSVAINYIRTALASARAAGLDVGALLETSGIPPTLVGEARARVSHRQYLRLTRAEFRREQPQHVDEYRLLFHCPLMFGEKRNAIAFPARFLEWPVAQTPRSLRRRLREEVSSYQGKDNIRRDAAIGNLSRPQLSIMEIAQLMGCSEPSTFHRALKKWTGLTPGAYRHGSADRLEGERGADD